MVYAVPSTPVMSQPPAPGSMAPPAAPAPAAPPAAPAAAPAGGHYVAPTGDPAYFPPTPADARFPITDATPYPEAGSTSATPERRVYAARAPEAPTAGQPPVAPAAAPAAGSRPVGGIEVPASEHDALAELGLEYLRAALSRPGEAPTPQGGHGAPQYSVPPASPAPTAPPVGLENPYAPQPQGPSAAERELSAIRGELSKMQASMRQASAREFVARVDSAIDSAVGGAFRSLGGADRDGLRRAVYLEMSQTGVNPEKGLEVVLGRSMTLARTSGEHATRAREAATAGLPRPVQGGGAPGPAQIPRFNRSDLGKGKFRAAIGDYIRAGRPAQSQGA